jgi:hypothetical protein
LLRDSPTLTSLRWTNTTNIFKLIITHLLYTVAPTYNSSLEDLSRSHFNYYYIR